MLHLSFWLCSVVMGLAWTAMGGTSLYIESTVRGLVNGSKKEEVLSNPLFTGTVFPSQGCAQTVILPLSSLSLLYYAGGDWGISCRVIYYRPTRRCHDGASAVINRGHGMDLFLLLSDSFQNVPSACFCNLIYVTTCAGKREDCPHVRSCTPVDDCTGEHLFSDCARALTRARRIYTEGTPNVWCLVGIKE
jgi:hypothetical protein